MNWLILVLAGLCEALFAFCLGKARLASGMEAMGWYGAFAVMLVISMALLIKATLTIPIGTAYAVWTGLGAVGTVIIGILFFSEPTTFWRLFFLCMLIISIIGLKLSS